MMTLANVITKHQGDIPCLGNHLGPRRHERAVQSWLCPSLAEDSEMLSPPVTSCSRSVSGEVGMCEQAPRLHHHSLAMRS